MIFPYSIHPFNIAKIYPKIWFYIKLIYCLTLFIVDFLILNSIISFFKFNKKPNFTNAPSVNNSDYSNHLKLLVGINPQTEEKIFIYEKGLYQNILVTGTIGSRKDKLCNVSIFKAIDGISLS